MRREENLVHGGWEGVGAATVENSVEFPQKTKRRTTYHMTQQFPPAYVAKEEAMDGGAWWHCSLWGCKESDMTKRLHFLSIVPFGERNGNPLQCSCLENPMDRGA